MTAENKVREFILDNYLFSDNQDDLNNSDSFLDKGIIDSTGILEVIFFLEEAFGIQVDDEEMVPENLDSVDKILAFIEKKKK